MAIEIELTKGKKAIVDDLDKDLAEYNWQAFDNRSSLCYARRSTSIGARKTKTILMHRSILSRSIGRILLSSEKCDHINGNGLDNRRENLRVASCAENIRNQKRRAGSSQYKGVSWKYWTGRPGKLYDKGKWRAQIMISGKRICLGWFENENDAARCYDKKAIEVYGNFARTNFPKEEYK